MDNNNSSSGGIGICGVLTIVFTVLKLCGLINWSWWWVLSPLWIGALLSLIVIVIYVAVILHEDNDYAPRRRKDKWKF